ncbi:hypothetical protein JTE90_016131 [Oedothorax gibbosus]|uniref:Serine/threonine-protein kinase 40 n=1 Tax=Oedothorax gibbosus TaxID=931172 RepID=A0AAV6U7G9_9ARAC|nr:hypothetical protein JTE90_016131 [Oedothorax gibbosus]
MDVVSKPKRAKLNSYNNFGIEINGKIISIDGSPFGKFKGVKRAGNYLLGPRLGNSPVRSIVQCLAKKNGTDNFYTLKILTLQELEDESMDDKQGKMLLHTEYSLLSLLQYQEGIVHHHGLFKDECKEEVDPYDLPYTGKRRQRVCLVLDCLCAHEFSRETCALINMQHYVIREKKLSEKEAVTLFYHVVRVVSDLHRQNVVHRDLKLGNIVLNKHTRKITITNFCLGKHLLNENDLLKDQRGSPAYISPDVLSGKPYLGKPSDMWALGVVLYTMLYGQFPFYDSVPQELFRKIKAAEYSIPGSDGRVSELANDIIRNLLVLSPTKRMTADQVLDSLNSILAAWHLTMTMENDFQIVPEYSPPDNKKDNTKETVCVGTSPNSDHTSNFDAVVVSSFQGCKRVQSKEDLVVGPINKKPRMGGIFAVCHVNEDETSLTQADIQKYHHLLPGSSGQ